MSLSHDSYDYLAKPHGIIVPMSEFELPVVIGQFFGVKGESHIIGKPLGRLLQCRLTADDYDDLEDLQADLEELSEKQGQLTGTLTLTVLDHTHDYPKCTFLGWTPLGEAFADGSGVHGWIQMLVLFWRQRSIT